MANDTMKSCEAVFEYSVALFCPDVSVRYKPSSFVVYFVVLSYGEIYSAFSSSPRTFFF